MNARTLSGHSLGSPFTFTIYSISMGATWRWNQILYSSLTFSADLERKRKKMIKGAKIELKSKGGGCCWLWRLQFALFHLLYYSSLTLHSFPLKLSGSYTLVSDLHIKHFLCCCHPPFLPLSHLCCPLPPVFHSYEFLILVYNSEVDMSDPEVFLPQPHRCKISLKRVEELEALSSSCS